MKRISILFIVMALFSLFLPHQAFAEKPIEVYLNGEKLSFPIDPFPENGTVLVPFRTIFEQLGLTVGWDHATQTVTGTKLGLSISFRVGEKAVTVNDEQMEFSVPSRVVNGTTLVPLRFISEVVGKEVIWDGNARTISINDFAFLMDGEQVLATDAMKILDKQYQLISQVQSAEYYLDVDMYALFSDMKRSALQLQMVAIDTFQPALITYGKGTMDFPIVNMDTDIEIFIINNKVYVKNVETGEWMLDDDDFSSEDFSIDYNQYIKPELQSLIEHIDSKVIGNHIELNVVYNAKQYNQILKKAGRNQEVSGVEVRMSIDPSTWYPIQSKVKITLPGNNIIDAIITEMNVMYFSFDKIQKIEIPKELQSLIFH